MHTALASVTFDEADAVWVEAEWAIYLDDSLGRWEVYIDAVGQRTFLSSDTWEGFDGGALAAFVSAYARDYYTDCSDTREMRRIDISPGGPYAKSARKAAKTQGVDTIVTADRLTSLAQRAQALAVQAAGINGAPSALQRQVFAVRHVAVAQELAALEQEVARLRSAVELSARTLRVSAQ